MASNHQPPPFLAVLRNLWWLLGNKMQFSKAESKKDIFEGTFKKNLNTEKVIDYI